MDFIQEYATLKSCNYWSILGAFSRARRGRQFSVIQYCLVLAFKIYGFKMYYQCLKCILLYLCSDIIYLIIVLNFLVYLLFIVGIFLGLYLIFFFGFFFLVAVVVFTLISIFLVFFRSISRGFDSYVGVTIL